MAKPSYAIDPFYMSDFSDTDSDDSGVEPIDEQEIYGELQTPASPCVCNFELIPENTYVVHRGLFLGIRCSLTLSGRTFGSQSAIIILLGVQQAVQTIQRQVCLLGSTREPGVLFRRSNN